MCLFDYYQAMTTNSYWHIKVYGMNGALPDCNGPCWSNRNLIHIVCLACPCVCAMSCCYAAVCTIDHYWWSFLNSLRCLITNHVEQLIFTQDIIPVYFTDLDGVWNEMNECQSNCISDTSWWKHKVWLCIDSATEALLVHSNMFIRHVTLTSC